LGSRTRSSTSLSRPRADPEADDAAANGVQHRNYAILEAMSDEERRQRAEERRRRAVLIRTRLGAPEIDLQPIEGPDAISLVTQLTRQSWALSGNPWPTYSRGEIPCRFVQGRPA